MKNIIIEPSGESKEVLPVDGQHFGLKELQKIVGGYIEQLYLPDGSILVVNEEGKLLGLPFNEKATELLNGTQYQGDFLAGTVIQVQFRNLEK